jgi:hypothetical protein
MTDAERQHVQRMFSAWRQISGDGKMVHVRFDRPAPWNDMHAFVEWCGKQRGAKTGTLRPVVLEELRRIADAHTSTNV